MSAVHQTARQRPLSQSSCHIKPHDMARQVGSTRALSLSLVFSLRIQVIYQFHLHSSWLLNEPQVQVGVE